MIRLAAEEKLIYHTQRIQRADSAEGKSFRAGSGGQDREFNDKVGAAGEGHVRTALLMKNSGNTSLGKISTHDHHDGVRTELLLGAGDLVGMSVVKRVVFRDDSDDIHESLQFLCVNV